MNRKSQMRVMLAFSIVLCYSSIIEKKFDSVCKEDSS